MESFKLLLKSYVQEKGFADFQIRSFDDFIEARIPNIVKQIKEIKPEVPDIGEFKIKLGRFKIGIPSVKEADGSVREILPLEARIRNLTYAAPMFIEMTPILNGIESETILVNFGDLRVLQVPIKYSKESSRYVEDECVGRQSHNLGHALLTRGRLEDPQFVLQPSLNILGKILPERNV